MAVTKPQQILGGAALPVTKRARESALEQRNAMNAAMGLDNFARLLKADSKTAVQTAQGQQADTMRAGGLPGFPGQNALGGAQPMHVLRQSLDPQLADLAGSAQEARSGLGNLQGMSSLQKIMQQSDNPLAIVKSLNPLNTARLHGSEGRQLAIRAENHRKQQAAEAAGEPERPVGALSAMFESGNRGAAAVGYDRTGGTSYGKYQLSSKAGSVDKFIDFLSKEEPDFAARLKKAGPANTGGRSGKMPQVWKELAAEQPERFEELQQQFINQSHFEPAMAKIKSQTGLDASDLSPAMLEVVFSTAVQHGVGAAGRIIGRALEAVGLDKLRSPNEKEALLAEQEAIRGVYKNRSRQFVSSTQQVREAVQGRLQTEMNMALGMLGGNLRA